jgi:uncharacterized NAD-dependent epimerase/dehydratase family protein
VVGTLEAGLALGPNALVIGIAPAGGQLPEEWLRLLAGALENKLEIWSGLHTFIGDIPELAALAKKHNVAIHDLRRPPAKLTVANGRVRDIAATVVLTVGTDCNIGKMTTQLQLLGALRNRGIRTNFAATGQTGILVEGRGIGVDAVIADFIAGAAERLVLECAEGADLVLVEGQGSIIHPSYSGVTYGLLHGSLPHAQILCAQPSRRAINRCEWVKIPPLLDFVRLSEAVAAPLRMAPVIGISLNTYDLDEDTALRMRSASTPSHSLTLLRRITARARADRTSAGFHYDVRLFGDARWTRVAHCTPCHTHSWSTTSGRATPPACAAVRSASGRFAPVHCTSRSVNA